MSLDDSPPNDLKPRPLDPTEDDDLTSELLESNPKFQAHAAKAKASPSKPFIPGTGD
jgi:hypothetical protein